MAAVGAASGEVAPVVSQVDLRAAATRSLGFLSKEGDKWLDERDCNACHHLPVLIWSLSEATRRGFDIDQEKLAEFVKWADERSTKGKGETETLALLQLAQPKRTLPALTKSLIDARQQDGTWKPTSQLAGMQRRDAEEAGESTTRLALFAIAMTNHESRPQMLGEAEKVFADRKPAKSLETLVFRTLYAHWFEGAERTSALRSEILKLQNPDGGWAWMIGESQSDALATGEVLYVLQQTDPSSCGPAITRAQARLLSSQREDGSWLIDITRISRIDRSSPQKSKSLKDAIAIYTFWGTAWATIGLLEGVTTP